MHGKGVMTSRDGTRYEWEFKDGLPNVLSGQGVKVLPDGTRIESDRLDVASEGHVRH